MKVFIDRTVPRYTEIKDKDFYFIVTAADTEVSNMKRTIAVSYTHLDVYKRQELYTYSYDAVGTIELSLEYHFSKVTCPSLLYVSFITSVSYTHLMQK